MGAALLAGLSNQLTAALAGVTPGDHDAARLLLRALACVYPCMCVPSHVWHVCTLAWVCGCVPVGGGEVGGVHLPWARACLGVGNPLCVP
jgi:hypothetical protein